MKVWVQKDVCSNFSEYVLRKTGKCINEIRDSGKKKYRCPGIIGIANGLKDSIQAGKPIHVIVDYDADGIGAGAEIYLILKELGAKNFKITVPKRLKDGYGMNVGMLENIPDEATILTIDNGIAAYQAIDEARRRGMTVYVLDHHQKNGPIPPANIIVDPEAFRDGWDFPYYCGAGLTFKLGEALFPGHQALLDQLSVFACLSTIADAVNVTEDNRNIILRGLNNMNNRRCPEGVRILLDYLKENAGLEHIGVDEIAYKIAPMINAPGRLFDEGGRFVLSSFFQKGDSAEVCAKKLYEVNEHRKSLVKEAFEKLDPKGEKIRFLYIPGFAEGLCGILAGQICEETHLPTFVMTDAQNGGIKGSARGGEYTDVFKLLSSVSGLFERFGGHPAAGAFSFKKENLEKVFEGLENAAPAPVNADNMYYDFTAAPQELTGIYNEICKIGVFGNGLPNPVIKVRAKIDDVKFIGSEKNHLSFTVGGTKCIAFFMVEKYRDLGSPTEINMYSNITTNWWKGRANMQMQVLDIEK